MGIRIKGKEKWRRHSGKAEVITGMYFLVFLAVILAAMTQMNQFMAVSAWMEDALAASNLASAVIDVREYGMSQTVCISPADEAYEVYREALRQNLALDENWEHENRELIGSAVTVEQYQIYNVKNQDITVYSYSSGEGSHTYVARGALGTLRTPDGTVIEATSVYSRIGFTVNGILGISLYATKDETVDIVSDLEKVEGGT